MAYPKTKIDYYAIDYALFGQRADRVLPKSVYIEYEATKQAVLDVLQDHAKLYKANLYIESTDYDDPESVAIQEASLMHKTLAKFTKQNNAIILDSAKEITKNLLERGFEFDQAVHLGLECAFAKRLLTDMLIMPILQESKVYNNTNPTAKQLLQDTYKILVSDLIECVLPYINVLKGSCCA